jgi:hypothetical protein
MVTNDNQQGTNHIQKVKHKTIHLSRNIAIALILLALLVAGIIAYTEPRIGQPKATHLVDNPPPIEPVAPQYLPCNGNESSIFLVSATPSLGPYPGPSVKQMGNTPGIKKGDPCFIINVTVRNDYSSGNPPPFQNIYNVTDPDAYIFLTAQIFNSQGQVNATDVTPPYPPVPYPGAYTSLASGENTSVTIYLATSHRDITSFKIILEYVGVLPPP